MSSSSDSDGEGSFTGAVTDPYVNDPRAPPIDIRSRQALEQAQNQLDRDKNPWEHPERRNSTLQ